MTLTGGTRTRLVLDSIVVLVEQILTDLGWFGPNRAHDPIVVRTGAQRWDEPLVLNTLVLTATTIEAVFDVELGSDLQTDRINVGIDFYAQNDALGVHLINDLRDGLRGRLSVGAYGSQIPVLDFRLATPVPIGSVAVTSLTAVRSITAFGEPWTRRVYSLDCTIEDTYYGA